MGTLFENLRETDNDPHLSPLARREPSPALPASGPEELARRVAELETVVAKPEGSNPPPKG
ncbi:hypothetical protein [Archangium lansingense]|uniref:Uncharacterized protein n=1 Tax=Archangium lansingense TaxID=2995310 RepID=A0ABT4A1U8_9BACT|nr:hypothetical protein [Archangium lansinium]MCY1075614.1 hypothetical protein [Archangium lansinium]